MMHFRQGAWLAMALFFCLVRPVSAEPLSVFVSVLPQKTMLEAIGGDKITVSVMLPSGASPELYAPPPKTMQALSAAAVYFSIGAPFEWSWLPRMKKQAAKTRFISLDAGLDKRFMAGHDHDDHHEHSLEEEAMPDPHVWLSPLHMAAMTDKAAAALAEVDPAHANFYAENAAAYKKKILAFHQRMTTRFDALPDAQDLVVVFHPSWGYVTDLYGLIQVAIEERGREPSAKQLAGLMKKMKQWKLPALFIQPQFSDRAARRIADSIGVPVVPLDPLAADWMAEIERLADHMGAP